jgi:hypothetical protein
VNDGTWQSSTHHSNGLHAEKLRPQKVDTQQDALRHNVWVLVRSMHERKPGLGLVVYFST